MNLDLKGFGSMPSALASREAATTTRGGFRFLLKIRGLFYKPFFKDDQGLERVFLQDAEIEVLISLTKSLCHSGAGGK